MAQDPNWQIDDDKFNLVRLLPDDAKYLPFPTFLAQRARQGFFTRRTFGPGLADLPVAEAAPVPRTGVAIGRVWLEMPDQSRRRFELPNVHLEQLSRYNQKVETAFPGRSDGTIKELSAIMDWQVSLRGTAVSDGRQQVEFYRDGLATTTYEFPLDILRSLKEFCDLRVSFRVFNEVFIKLGITHLSIDNIVLPFERGATSHFEYAIDAKSDNPTGLIDPTNLRN